MGRKLGWGLSRRFFWMGSWVPIYLNVAGAEAYLLAKFHCHPSSRLATIHQRLRQTDNQTDRQTVERSDSIGRTALQTVAQKCLVNRDDSRVRTAMQQFVRRSQ